MYSKLRRRIIAVTLLVSIAPLMTLGLTIYFQFARTHRGKIEEQIRYRAESQARAVDLFLKEHTAVLASITDILPFDELNREDSLSRIFNVLNYRAGALIDMGVIDSGGRHVAYTGPYNLKGFNYSDQPWFTEAMAKGVYISDVYMGYRRLPHFIIAVRRQENQQNWILRATIDLDVLNDIARSAKLGRSGDAYIVNDEGIFQTRPRFKGEVLDKSEINPRLFGGEVTVMEISRGAKGKVLYAGCWLKNKRWLFVISQDSAEEMGSLFRTRNLEILIVTAGILAIILTTVLITRLIVNRLKAAEEKMNRMNAQLMHSDKLAALGKMAAGVAHEINNPLAVILQKTGWIKDLLQEEEVQNTENRKEIETSIDKIEQHVERARKVIHGMLGYARKMEPRLEDVDINETLNQTVSILENYAGINNIAIKTDLSSDLPIIAGDQARLQQVFLNLITNAIDAIEKDGQVDVVTRKTESQIRVYIRDNGPGISPEQQKRVFEPFFTTKQESKGTGLGLWISYNIVESMGGRLTFQSNLDEGTTFTVEIPIVLPEKK